jgi:hypothetical protein
VKRVTLLCESISEPDDEGDVQLRPAYYAQHYRDVDYWVSALSVVSVEDIPNPLPTEPGARFWGSYDKTVPCWWFVMADRRDGGGVRYVSQYGIIGDGHPSGIHSTSIAAERLVRLPDPEPQPCTGARSCTASPHVHGCYADHGGCDETQWHDGDGAGSDAWRNVGADGYES